MNKYQLTEDKDADDEDDGEKKAVKCINSLVNIMHAAGHSLALSSVLSYGEDHFFETDVAVAIFVKRCKTFFSLILTTRAHDFN